MWNALEFSKILTVMRFFDNTKVSVNAQKLPNKLKSEEAKNSMRSRVKRPHISHETKSVLVSFLVDTIIVWSALCVSYPSNPIHIVK